MSDTPESFAAVLEDLARSGRARSHPVPAASIHVLGRSRQRRQRLTVATSGVLACAVAVGIVATTRGVTTGGGPAGPLGTPTIGSTSATSKVADTAARFLQPTDLPDQWRKWLSSPTHRTPDQGRTVQICGSSTSTAAQSADAVQYKSDSGQPATATETVYHYDSFAAADSAYAKLVPDPQQCATGLGAGSMYTHGSAGDVGFAMNFTTRDAKQQITAITHLLITRAGSEVAVFTYAAPADTQTSTDPAQDWAALDRMTSRLRGETPKPPEQTSAQTSAPNQNAAPPPDSVWLKAEEVPFANADQSHGWYLMSPPQSGSGPSAPANLCAGMMFAIAGDEHAALASQMWHGTPDKTPVGPGNYLYSDANQLVYHYPDATSAHAAFTKAKGILAAKSCAFSDPDGTKGTRKITAGPQSPAAFSVAADDSAGLGVHGHLYVVIKGDYVAEVDIHFQSGMDNTDMSKDQAFLDLLTSKLP